MDQAHIEGKSRRINLLLASVILILLLSSVPVPFEIDVHQSSIEEITSGRSFLVVLPEPPKLAPEFLSKVHVNHDNQTITIEVRASYFIPRLFFPHGHDSAVLLGGLFSGQYEVIVSNGFEKKSLGMINVSL